jgi:hypothetical protein
MNMIFVLLAGLLFPSGALGQIDRPAARLPKPSNAPFDPRDLNGVWNWTNSDRGYNTEVPPLTAEGERRLNANRPNEGQAVGTPVRPGMHIGRFRAVHPAQSNDPSNECNPPGVPRLFLNPGPFEFFQVPGRILQVVEWHRVFRDIWMQGTTPPEVDRPRFLGYSEGRWEGNTLVVDTHDFDDRTWLDYYGYPHSDEMKVQERYTRVSKELLEVSITVTDPRIYTKPWVSSKKVFVYEPDRKIGEEYCAPLDEVQGFNQRTRDLSNPNK